MTKFKCKCGKDAVMIIRSRTRGYSTFCKKCYDKVMEKRAKFKNE